MIESVLEEIKIAEAKALSIRTEADDYALQKNKDAEALSVALKKEAEAKIKSLKKARKEALIIKERDLYDGVIAAAKKDSDALYNSLSSKIDVLSDEIVGKVLNGDC